ncbi:MAG: hypothetical protein ACRDJE_04425 [Dehalococcoidia bacterium]
MLVCSACYVIAELDDIVVAYDGEWCLCLYCDARRRGLDRPVPEALRRAVGRILAALEAG